MAIELAASGNFRKIDKVGSFADELGTIAYAMWVSTVFYLMVTRAFVIIRNEAMLSSRIATLALIEKDQLLADNMPKASALMGKAKTFGISWIDACQAARVIHPSLAKAHLLDIGKFCKVFDHDKNSHVIKPIPRPFQLGYFKHHRGRFGGAEGWKVSASGVLWLESRAQEINAATWERKRQHRKKAGQRVAT